jgi:hypothetical protein
VSRPGRRRSRSYRLAAGLEGAARGRL